MLYRIAYVLYRPVNFSGVDPPPPLLSFHQQHSLSFERNQGCSVVCVCVCVDHMTSTTLHSHRAGEKGSGVGVGGIGHRPFFNAKTQLSMYFICMCVCVCVCVCV